MYDSRNLEYLAQAAGGVDSTVQSQSIEQRFYQLQRENEFLRQKLSESESQKQKIAQGACDTFQVALEQIELGALMLQTKRKKMETEFSITANPRENDQLDKENVKLKKELQQLNLIKISLQKQVESLSKYLENTLAEKQNLEVRLQQYEAPSLLLVTENCELRKQISELQAIFRKTKSELIQLQESLINISKDRESLSNCLPRIIDRMPIDEAFKAELQQIISLEEPQQLPGPLPSASNLSGGSDTRSLEFWSRGQSALSGDTSHSDVRTDPQSSYGV